MPWLSSTVRVSNLTPALPPSRSHSPPVLVVRCCLCVQIAFLARNCAAQRNGAELSAFNLKRALAAITPLASVSFSLSLSLHMYDSVRVCLAFCLHGLCESPKCVLRSPSAQIS